MGWASAVEIFDLVVGKIIDVKGMSDNDKSDVIVTLYEALRDNDWDTFGESEFYENPLVKKSIKQWEEDNMVSYSEYDDEDVEEL
jgi:hypothetical protein